MPTALLILILVAQAVAQAATAGASGPAATPSDGEMALPWVHVVGRVEAIEGARVTVRKPDGRTVTVHVGGLTLDVVDVLHPGRDVVLYGPRRADGTVIARGLALDYGDDAASASPHMP